MAKQKLYPKSQNMHKRIFASLVLLMMVCCVFAQSSKLSPATQLLLSEYADVTPKGKFKAAAKVKNSSQRVLTVVLLNEGAEVSDETFNSLGIEVVKRRGTVVFANVPVNRLKALAEVEGIRSINAGGKFTSYNDHARQNTMVDQVHEMTKENSSVADVPEKFRGKDVLVAIIDSEIDFGHPAFRDANGKTRVKQYMKVEYDKNGKVVHEVAVEQDQMDNALKLADVLAQVGHGTHVAGVAAGSTAALADDDPAKKLYGMAPEADLLFYDGYKNFAPQTLFAISDAFDIADKEQRPLVINMSFGNISALTDGTDDLSMGFAELIKSYNMEGKVICVAAANNGDIPTAAIFLCERPIADDGDWTLQKKVACASQLNGVQLEGSPVPVYSLMADVSFYSSDAREFAVKYDFVNFETKEIIASTPLLTLDYLEQLHGQPVKLEEEGDDSGYLVVMGCTTQLSPTNRFFHSIYLNQALFTVPVRMEASVFTKETGMTINTAVEGNNLLRANNDPEDIYAVPEFDGSMNLLCSTDNFLSVGSYQSHENFINHEGKTGMLYKLPAGTISPFSSYRTEKYGYPGPYVIAPGGHLVSAYHHNIKNPKTGGLTDETVSVTNYNGVDYKWGHMSGTSMATPAAAGIIALWLQADPTLTVADVRNILKETADYDEFCEAEPARVGVGKINALRGLQYILSTSGIKTVGADSNCHATKRLDSRGNIVIEKNGQLYNVVGTRIAQ